MRDELNIKEDEVSDNDIVKVFTPYKKDDNFTHIYVQFNKTVHASWCLHLGRTVLQGKNSKVFHYIPRQFFERFKTLDQVAFQKRREGFKTRIEFSDTDIVLLTSPRGQYQFTPLVVPDLPPVDLTPLRTPPKGRKPIKRPRSPNSSPTDDPSKKPDRKESPPPPPRDAAQNVGIDSSTVCTPAAENPSDVGCFQSMETSTPGTARMLFTYDQGTLNNPRRASLNF